MQKHTQNLGNNPWRVTESSFRPEHYSLNATLFALGNGYIGLRGTFEEGLEGAADQHGCYLNGVYFSEPITYGESAYGYAKNNQRIASTALPHQLSIKLNGELMDMKRGKVLEHRRELQLDNGLLSRDLRWQTEGGQILKIESRRLVSLTDRHLIVTEYRVTPENFSGRLEISSYLDATPAQTEASDDPRVGSGINPDDLKPLECQADEHGLLVSQRLRSSGFTLVSAATDRFHGTQPLSTQSERLGSYSAAHYHQLDARAGETITLTKYALCYSWLHENEEVSTQKIQSHLLASCQSGFGHYAQQQRQAMDRFWQDSDIEIEGDPELQQGLRFNLFHLFQSLGRTPGTNIAAKGLTGHGYDGHYFWDSEIYIFPFFLYTQPELARNLIQFRYSLLDAARDRARELAISKGALFPWRTIGGEECSAYYPAGTAQFHINADVAYSIKQYHLATGDNQLILDVGAEVVWETARLWLQIGHYNPHRGNRFCINEVTGPDEYTALVNNNYFTNAMAQAHLRYASELYHWLQSDHPGRFEELVQNLNLSEAEVNEWREAAERMFLPYDDESGIHLQDDSFLDKPRWDFANTPKDKYPLLLHYHPLTIYRHQVCKQADTVLALFLLSENFSLEEKRRDYDFYEPITTHDSTLSACMHSILANELGYADKARHYFSQVARMDLDNHHNNTQHGVHTACMGGTWLCMVQGFAGMRIHKGQLHFAPTRPEGITHYRFKVRFQGRQLSVSVAPNGTRYQLLSGPPLTLISGDQELRLEQPNTDYTATTLREDNAS